MNKNLSPKFLLEDNLIRLAKWLRLLGYDAAVHSSTSLSSLISIANKEKRVFLTRSKKIFKLKQKFSRFLIKETLYINQLYELKNYIKIDDEHLFSRCTHCNVYFSDIERSKIKDLIPKAVFEAFEDYKICRRCGKIYWQETHYHIMKLTLEKIFLKQ